jgi:hypothetical protein
VALATLLAGSALAQTDPAKRDPGAQPAPTAPDPGDQRQPPTPPATTAGPSASTPQGENPPGLMPVPHDPQMGAAKK